MRAKECSAAQRRCEKWWRQRQLGGCGREAAVHGPLLMAGGAKAIGKMGKRWQLLVAEPLVKYAPAAVRAARHSNCQGPPWGTGEECGSLSASARRCGKTRNGAARRR